MHTVLPYLHCWETRHDPTINLIDKNKIDCFQFPYYKNGLHNCFHLYMIEYGYNQNENNLYFAQRKRKATVKKYKYLINRNFILFIHQEACKRHGRSVLQQTCSAWQQSKISGNVPTLHQQASQWMIRWHLEITVIFFSVFSGYAVADWA